MVKKSQFILDSKCTITNVPDSIKRQIADQLTISNPEYYTAQKYGGWVNNISPVLRFYKIDKDNNIVFERGFAHKAWAICKKEEFDTEFVDNRKSFAPCGFSFKLQLRDYQKEASKGIRKTTQGVLRAGTGAGKTVTALDIIAKRQQPTLVLVHTKELLYQWKDRVKEFLDEDAGLFGAGKKEIKPITIGMVQTVRKHLDKLKDKFGHIVVDECHRTPSSTFLECASAFDAKYTLGLTATPIRRDGLAKVIFLSLGDLAHEVNPGRLRNMGAILTPYVYQRKTNFQYAYDDDYAKMIKCLVEDNERNQMIANDVSEMVSEGTILVASDRIDQLERIADMVNVNGSKAMLTGRVSAKKREKIVEDLREGKVSVLFSTYSLLGEGFDASGLDSLFLASPIRFEGKLVQLAGRILRPKEGKTAKIYDYQDVNQPVLDSQVRQRNAIYNENNFKIVDTELENNLRMW